MDEYNKLADSSSKNSALYSPILGLSGAVLGAVAGYYVCYWFLTQGFYAIALPGVFIGLGSRIFLRKNDLRVNIFCAVFALAAGLFVEWKFFPFIKDSSLFYYVTHLQLLKPVTWILIGIGTVLAYHFSRIPSQPAANARPLPESSSSEKNPVE
jgi:hypothetical protein